MQVANFTITPDILADIITTVIESPVGDWLLKLTVHQSRPAANPVLGYADPAIYNDKLQLYIAYDDSDGQEATMEQLLTYDDLERGFDKLMEANPNIVRAFAEETYDSNDADIWFQYVVFGKVIYG